MTSPGSRVRLVEMKLTSWKQLKMSWLVFEFWRKLAVLEELDGQLVRVDLGFHVRPQRREGVERLAPAPLALGVSGSCGR